MPHPLFPLLFFAAVPEPSYRFPFLGMFTIPRSLSKRLLLPSLPHGQPLGCALCGCASHSLHYLDRVRRSFSPPRMHRFLSSANLISIFLLHRVVSVIPSFDGCTVVPSPLVQIVCQVRQPPSVLFFFTVCFHVFSEFLVCVRPSVSRSSNRRSRSLSCSVCSCVFSSVRSSLRPLPIQTLLCPRHILGGAIRACASILCGSSGQAKRSVEQVGLDVHRESVTSPEQEAMVPCDTAVYADGMLSSTQPFCDASTHKAFNKGSCQCDNKCPSSRGHDYTSPREFTHASSRAPLMALQDTDNFTDGFLGSYV